MHGFRSTHSVLVRSLTELDVRDPSLIDTSLPVDTIPVAGQLVNPLVGDKPNGGQQPPASPGNSPSGSSPPGNSPPDTPPPDTTSAGGNKNKNANGGGNSPTNSPTPTSGGDFAFQPVALSNTTPTSNLGKPSSSPSAKNGNVGSTSTNSLGAAGSGSSSVSSGQATSASVMSGAPSGSLPTSLGPLATNILDASQSSLGSSSHTVGALAPSSTTTGATSAGERLSVGTITGISIVCLFILLTLILLAFRRRSIARRVELRNQWWFNHNLGGRSFSPTGRPHSTMNTNGEVSARLSARSSFATTFDQGLMFRVDSPSRFSAGVAPEYPPMAEVRERNSVLISTGATVARRTSMKSMLIHGNDPDTQYLAVSTGQNNLEPFTPMSVRPFSPSESFSFPKPPMQSSTDSFFFLGEQGHTSSVSSAATLVQVTTPHPALLIDHTPANPQSLTLSAVLSPLTAAANTSPDPFVDPIEVVRRPFAPSLNDELMVYAGDHVHIFQIFDDGWAFVEKLAGTEEKEHERGLIPLDCLREADQPLPTFLAQKRISYRSDQPIGYAQ